MGLAEVDLVAHDVAGPAGILLAVRSPARVRRLVLLNTTLHRRDHHPPLPAVAQFLPVLREATRPYLPPPNAERLAKAFPNATLQLLAGAGRFLQEDAPEDVAERISKFFA